jgi:hypothetical protein
VLNYLQPEDLLFLVPFSDRVSISQKNRRQEGKRQTKKTCTNPSNQKDLVLLFTRYERAKYSRIRKRHAESAK